MEFLNIFETVCMLRVNHAPCEQSVIGLCPCALLAQNCQDSRVCYTDPDHSCICEVDVFLLPCAYLLCFDF